MTTVQSKVTDYQDLVPFFYLRITGLPFYVFASVNPSDSTRYGSFAWSAPTGFPTTWAQRGLQLPDDTIEQKFTDIIGGVASPGRCRLSVIDFADPLHPGFGYFSRLFAAGRALSDSSIPTGVLDSPISAVPGVDSDMEVRGASVAWPHPADVYVGAETIGISAVSSNGDGSFELDFAARNKYVCYGNSADGGNFWPPIPYHRVAFDSSGNALPGQSPTVSGDVPDVLGRTAALWIGHMRPDGNPEPETSSACLLLGRVTGLEIGKVGGMFDITVDSITGDLAKAICAPDLQHATIQPGFYLANASWCSFYYTGQKTATLKVSVSPGVYLTPQALATAVTASLAFAGAPDASLQVGTGDGGDTFQFQCSTGGLSFSVSPIPLNVTNPTVAPALASLLYALGFDPTGVFFNAAGNGSNYATLLATRPCASVFVPTLDAANANALNLVEPHVAANFFNNAEDGTGQAWARFGDGQVVQVLSSTGGTGNTVTTGQYPLGTSVISQADDSQPGFGRFYYVEAGGIATIDQVIMFISYHSLIPSFTHFLGSLLASSTGYVTDADLNYFPEGVGLGWVKLLTAADWSIDDEGPTPRACYIDSTTKWADIFTPYAREHGLFIVWDPSLGGIRLRRFQVPTTAGATVSGVTNAAFTESNRAKESDRTSQKTDRSSLRTSWKIQPTFSAHFTKTPPPAVVIVDVRARSMYPNDARQEDIDDKTLIATPSLGDTIAQLLRLYGQPWTTCQRSMNKRGMLLAPGTIHQIVDNTLVNPFTGASGITVGDAVYGVLTRVAMNPSTGDVTIEFMINSSDDQSLYRQWSPSALVDFSLSSAGYSNGYNSSTKQLSTVAYYGTAIAGDGSYFAAGDTIRVHTRDNSQDAFADQSDTVASVSGGVLTLTTGIAGVSSTVQSVVVLQKYNSATTSRKTGAMKVSWQGEGSTRIIQGTASARLNKWA